MILNLFSRIQYSEILGWVLLLVNAILSSFLSELLFRKKRFRFLKLCAVSLVMIMLIFGITLVLLAVWFYFVPQQQSLGVLLKKILAQQGKDFIIPLAATLFAGWALNSMPKNKQLAKSVFCIIMVMTLVVSSVLFFLNSFRMIQRPHYDAPIESITSIINSRLSTYPMILTRDIMYSIGDGSELIEKNDDAVPDYNYDSDEEENRQEYEEPDTFSGYIKAIVRGMYDPNGSMLDYLEKAYSLFKEGKHNNNLFYIGLFWNYLYDEYYWFAPELEITEEECLQKALKAYRQCEEENMETASAESLSALYHNMAIIYNEMSDRESTRDCLRKSLEYGTDVSITLLGYIQDIYYWVENEDAELLMQDAETVMQYSERGEDGSKNLSMYILYGACAIAENKNIDIAYDKLCQADEYFEGKSLLVKILRCICADLINVNDLDALYEVYTLEEKNGLTDVEEVYLVRYLFTTNRYEELWGYISDVGTERMEYSAEQAAIKSVWYFRNPETAVSNTESIEVFLQQVEEKLNDDLAEDEEELLLLSQMLLKNSLGQAESGEIGEYSFDELSDIQFVFCATTAFNNAEYELAIRYCEAFFDSEKNSNHTAERGAFSLWQLEPQEQMALHYYTQLIFAHSHFEYAMECARGSEERKLHMEIAEKECVVFKQSSKSLLYLGEKFETLQRLIDSENGTLSESFESSAGAVFEVDEL